ncbi:MAG: choline/ethanolamine kinase family protein, partial [Paracoccaceae bacterium]
MAGDNSVARIRELPFWQGKIDPVPIDGGLTNFNYLVEDAAKRYVVRLGSDIPEHHVMRFNELSASRAAHAAGVSPAVVYAEPGVMILDFIQSRTLTETAIGSPGMLEKIVPLIKSCHRDIPKFLRGPSLIFWVFHVIRDY